VLPVEALEVPVHRPRKDPALGTVEEPEEIIADKVVASADRWNQRGTLKTTDLYDLWYLLVQLRVEPPDPALVGTKVRDYGGTPRGADLAAAVRAISREKLRAALEGVLPAPDLGAIDEMAILETVARLFTGYRHAL